MSMSSLPSGRSVQCSISSDEPFREANGTHKPLSGQSNRRSNLGTRIIGQRLDLSVAHIFLSESVERGPKAGRQGWLTSCLDRAVLGRTIAGPAGDPKKLGRAFGCSHSRTMGRGPFGWYLGIIGGPTKGRGMDCTETEARPTTFASCHRSLLLSSVLLRKLRGKLPLFTASVSFVEIISGACVAAVAAVMAGVRIWGFSCLIGGESTL